LQRQSIGSRKHISSVGLMAVQQQLQLGNQAAQFTAGEDLLLIKIGIAALENV